MPQHIQKKMSCAFHLGVGDAGKPALRLCENSRADPATPSLPCHGKDEGMMPPIYLAAGKRVRELALTLTICSTDECWPFTPTRQQTRAAAAVWGTGEPALRK